MIEVRIASDSEVVKLKDLTSSLIPPDFSGRLNTEQIDTVYERMYAQEVRLNNLNSTPIYLIASFNGEDCALVSYLRQGPDLFHLNKIAVLPDFRAQGVGTALFETAIRQIKEEHPTPCKVELTVNSHNKDYAFYEKMGMHKVREELIDLDEFTLTQDVLELEI